MGAHVSGFRHGRHPGPGEGDSESERKSMPCKLQRGQCIQDLIIRAAEKTHRRLTNVPMSHAPNVSSIAGSVVWATLPVGLGRAGADELAEATRRPVDIAMQMGMFASVSGERN